MTAVRESGASSGAEVLATFDYDDLGRRTTLTRGDGAVTTYAYDAASRLESLANDLTGTSADQTLTFTRNLAGQVLERSGSNGAYAPVMADTSKSYTANGLNQLAVAAGVSMAYDAAGNLSDDGAKDYAYDVANRLTSVTGATLSYDVGGRLAQTVASATTVFLYDGADLIGEYDDQAALLRRYVHGPDVDEPLVWYEGSDSSDRRWLVSDQLGSVIAVADEAGDALAVNTYDEYGQPGVSNTGRFQYTGQTWLPEVAFTWTFTGSSDRIDSR